MAKLVQDLLKARALIEKPSSFLKGHSSDGDTRFGVDGAIRLVGFTDPKRVSAMWTALCDAIPAKKRKPLGLRLLAYTDAPETTHADILKLFDRAINRATAA